MVAQAPPSAEFGHGQLSRTSERSWIPLQYLHETLTKGTLHAGLTALCTECGESSPPLRGSAALRSAFLVCGCGGQVIGGEDGSVDDVEEGLGPSLVAEVAGSCIGD